MDSGLSKAKADAEPTGVKFPLHLPILRKALMCKGCSKYRSIAQIVTTPYLPNYTDAWQRASDANVAAQNAKQGTQHLGDGHETQSVSQPSSDGPTKSKNQANKND